MQQVMGDVAMRYRRARRGGEKPLLPALLMCCGRLLGGSTRGQPPCMDRVPILGPQAVGSWCPQGRDACLGTFISRRGVTSQQGLPVLEGLCPCLPRPLAAPFPGVLPPPHIGPLTLHTGAELEGGCPECQMQLTRGLRVGLWR